MQITQVQCQEASHTFNKVFGIRNHLTSSLKTAAVGGLPCQSSDTESSLDDSHAESVNSDHHARSDKEEHPEVDLAEKPLFDGAATNIGTTMILLLAFITKHRLKGGIIGDLIDLINTLFIGSSEGCAITTAGMQHYVQNIKYPLSKHYYCTRCQIYVGEETDLPDRCPLESCGEQLTTEGATSYFVTLPIQLQLSELLSNGEILESVLSARDVTGAENVSYITNGQLYKSFLSLPDVNIKHFLTFLWNTDGVSVFRSSHYDIWPMYLAINELPQHLRFKQENLILSCLWFGKKKPVMTTFMRSMYEQLKSLENGVDLQTADGKKNFHCYILAGTADLPARAIVLNMTQYNGEDSCHKCYDSGLKLRTERGGNIHYYNADPSEKKNDVDFKQDGVYALDESSIQRGIKALVVRLFWAFHTPTTVWPGTETYVLEVQHAFQSTITK